MYYDEIDVEDDRFQWNKEKSEINIAKHGVSFKEVVVIKTLDIKY